MDERLSGLRVLLTTDAVGGVWTYSLDLARELGRNGIETVLAVLGPPPGDAARAAALRIPGLELVTTGLPLDWMAETPEEVLEAGVQAGRSGAPAALRAGAAPHARHSPRRDPSMCRSIAGSPLLPRHMVAGGEGAPMPRCRRTSAGGAPWWRAASPR